ncbi:hypothetical protein [Pendulispora albinea]|uniref:Uncharacterized protein n=1 Tax=Pendulispora albinea TaxID=2741071 RepID=A0ABZ2M7K1_9BACT
MPRHFESIRERLLNPQRVALQEAMAAVRGLRDPAAVWAALASHGVIPASWLDDPRRHFRLARRSRVKARCTRRLNEHSTCTPSSVGTYPDCAEDAVAIASDAQGVEAAEALAREAMIRLEPWSRDPQPRGSDVVWQLVTASADASVPGDAMFLAFDVYATIVAHAERHGFAPSAAPRGILTARGRSWVAWYAAQGCAAWQALVDQRARIGDFDRAPFRASARRYSYPLQPVALGERLSGQRFADRDNPFEPLFDVHALGYAMAAMSHDAIALRAPRADRRGHSS